MQEKSFTSSTTTISDPNANGDHIEQDRKPERSKFDRWESYPLDEAGYHPAQLNLRHCKDRLDADIHRIAGEDTCIQMLVLDSTEKGKRPSQKAS